MDLPPAAPGAGSAQLDAVYAALAELRSNIDPAALAEKDEEISRLSNEVASLKAQLRTLRYSQAAPPSPRTSLTRGGAGGAGGEVGRGRSTSTFDLRPMSERISGDALRAQLALGANSPLLREPSLAGMDQSPGAEFKASIRLTKCSDESCEELSPPDNSIRTEHQSHTTVKLDWDTPPQRVLVIKKPNDPEVLAVFRHLCQWLAEERQLTVLVEPVVHAELQLPFTETWEARQAARLDARVDFIVCLGGDGTILWVSNLFAGPVPPVISFAMGSLGFLTPFDVERAHSHLDRVLQGDCNITLRSRLVAHVVPRHMREALDADREQLPASRRSSVRRGTAEASSWHQALNDVAIERGLGASLVDLEVFSDGHDVTNVVADGLIVASPTGSTAYSLSAGGSMVHPAVPALLMTPICPHGLSFRPLLFPDSTTLEVRVAERSRFEASVCFDGRNRTNLARGDSVFIKMSSYPVPCFCKDLENADWFGSVKNNLHWNSRGARQKPWKPPTVYS